jgi:hypothetical protein
MHPRWASIRRAARGRLLPTADVGYPVAQLGGPLSGGEIARPTGACRPPAVIPDSELAGTKQSLVRLGSRTAHGQVRLQHSGPSALSGQPRTTSDPVIAGCGVQRCDDPLIVDTGLSLSSTEKSLQGIRRDVGSMSNTALHGQQRPRGLKAVYSTPPICGVHGRSVCCRTEADRRRRYLVASGTRTRDCLSSFTSQFKGFKRCLPRFSVSGEGRFRG